MTRRGFGRAEFKIGLDAGIHTMPLAPPCIRFTKVLAAGSAVGFAHFLGGVACTLDGMKHDHQDDGRGRNSLHTGRLQAFKQQVNHVELTSICNKMLARVCVCVCVYVV